MNRFYAHIDVNNIVTGVMRTHGEIKVRDMIEIPAYDESILGNLFDPIDGSFTPQPDPPIRQITTQAFYRRMSKAERNSVRSSNDDDVKDLREDLGRSPVVNLDRAISQQLLSTPIFDQLRTTELLVNGTPEETETG